DRTITPASATSASDLLEEQRSRPASFGYSGASAADGRLTIRRTDAADISARADIPAAFRRHLPPARSSGAPVRGTGLAPPGRRPPGPTWRHHQGRNST